jgi:hypothetical protein
MKLLRARCAIAKAFSGTRQSPPEPCYNLGFEQYLGA